MNKKFFFVLVGVFCLAYQNSFAKESLNQFAIKDNVSLEDNEKIVEKNNLFANQYSYLPYLQFGGYRFFNLNTAKAAIDSNVFIPLWQSPSQLVFSHLRFFDRTGKPFEGNIHVGYRHLAPEKEHLYGIYGAFDRRRTDFGNYFNQLTVGVEGWFHKVFIGGNFYQPIGDTSKYLGTTSVTGELDRVQNNIWITKNKLYEKAIGGGDAEVGYELVQGLVGYVGGYYFGAKDVDVIAGPKGRVTYDWTLDNGKRVFNVFDKFGLEGGVQRDTPRGTTYYLSVNARVGLLPNKEGSLLGVARHMVDLVRRDVDVISSTIETTDSSSLKDPNGKEIKIVTVVEGDEGITKNFTNALASSAAVVSLKGEINLNVIAKQDRTIQGDKIIVCGNTYYAALPEGKVPVDISAPNVPTGTIVGSIEAINSFLGGDEVIYVNSAHPGKREVSDAEPAYQVNVDPLEFRNGRAFL